MARLTEIPSAAVEGKPTSEEETRAITASPSDDGLNGEGEDVSSDEEDEDEILEETVWERVAALSDLVPAHRRERWAKTAAKTASGAWTFGKFLGRVAWIVSTSAVLVVLPLIFEIQKEPFDAEFMEWQYMQAQKAGMLPPGAPSGGASTMPMPGQLPPGALPPLRQ